MRCGISADGLEGRGRGPQRSRAARRRHPYAPGTGAQGWSNRIRIRVPRSDSDPSPWRRTLPYAHSTGAHTLPRPSGAAPGACHAPKRLRSGRKLRHGTCEATGLLAVCFAVRSAPGQAAPPRALPATPPRTGVHRPTLTSPTPHAAVTQAPRRGGPTPLGAVISLAKKPGQPTSPPT